MNCDKLFQSRQEKILTDLALTLIDDNHQLVLDLHKIILYASCVYFEKLFFNFKEKDANNITIRVPNAFVAHDLIMSFYGQTTNLGQLYKDKHILETIKCYDFLGLEYDESLLDNNITVLEEDFELLLDVVDLVGYDDDTIKLINKNLPKNYDLTKFPKELLIEMLRLAKMYNFISAGKDHKIKIWDPDTHEPIDVLREHTDMVWCVRCSSDNKYIASASDDCTVKIWDAQIGEIIHTLKEHTKGVISVCFSPDNIHIASGSHDRTIKIWNVQTGQCIRTLTDYADSIWSVCYSPDNIWLACGGDYVNQVMIWNVETYDLIHILAVNKNSSGMYMYGNNNHISSINFSPDSKYIIVGNRSNIKIYDVTMGQLIHTFADYIDRVNSICYSPDNTLIAAGTDNNSVLIWDAKTYLLIDKFYRSGVKNEYMENGVLSVCFTPDSKYIISGNSDWSIKIWDLKTGVVVNLLKSHKGNVWSVCCSSTHNGDLVKKITEMDFFKI